MFSYNEIKDDASFSSPGGGTGAKFAVSDYIFYFYNN